MLPVLNLGSDAPEVYLARLALTQILGSRQQSQASLQQSQLPDRGPYDQRACQAMTEWQTGYEAVRRLPIGAGVAPIRTDGVVDSAVWSALGVSTVTAHAVQRFGQTHPMGCWRTCAHMLNRVCRELPLDLQTWLEPQRLDWLPRRRGEGQAAESVRHPAAVRTVGLDGGLKSMAMALNAYATFVGGRLVSVPSNLQPQMLAGLMRSRPVIALGSWGRQGPRHAVVLSAMHRVSLADDSGVTQHTTAVRVEDPDPMPTGSTYCARLVTNFYVCANVNFFMEHLVVF